MAIVTPVVSKVASPFKTGISGTQPVNTLAPAIAGQPYIGETLTATPGTWTDADSVSGQWHVNGVATGDTDTSYTILLADAGLSIEYRETATNTAGSVTQASNAITAATLEQHVTRMFASGEQGAWNKLADAATLFQDAAGTTPVTAVGQPVGRILDKSGRGNNAAQSTTTARPILPAAGYRLRSDFTDDALPVTLPAFNGEVWVNTPYGHYMTTRSATTATDYRLPLNDATEVIIREGTTTQQQRDAISAYFGNDKAPYGSIMLSPDTSINIGSYALGVETPAVIRYIGANGVSVEKTYPTGNTTTAYDLAADGLTAPVAMILLHTGARYFTCNTNQLTGSIPSLASNTAFTLFYCYSNQLTGSIPSLASNTALTIFFCYSNQLTGSIPSLSNNTALTQFRCYSNQLTGSIPSLASNTALTIFFCYSNQLTGVEAGFAVAPSLGEFQAQNNSLTAAAVNAILAAFVAANRTTGTRILNLGGTGNAAPTGQGLTDKATLQSRGWTVTTN